MTIADVYLSAFNGWNTIVDQTTRATKVRLITIYGATNLQNEIRIKSYILAKLFGLTSLVEGYTLVVNWIDTNFERSECQV